MGNNSVATFQYIILIGKSGITIWNSRHWRHLRWWRQNAANCDQLAPMMITIGIGASGDHWCNLNGSIGTISWQCVFHNRQLMINGAIGVNGAIGNFGDPLVQMVIHRLHWRHWCRNGTNESIGDPLALLTPLVSMLLMEPMTPVELLI